MGDTDMTKIASRRDARRKEPTANATDADRSNGPKKKRGSFSVALTLRTRIVAMLLVFGLVPAGVVLAILMSQKGEFRAAMSTRIAMTAANVNDVVDRNLFARYGDVQAFALNNAARIAFNWMNPSPDNTLVQAMNGYMRGYGIYKLMIMVNPSGTVMAVNSVDAAGNPLDTRTLYNHDFSGATWLKKVKAGEFLQGRNGLTGTVVEQPAKSDIVSTLYGEDGYSLVFAAPVLDDSGNLIGVWANFADFGLVEEIVAYFYKGLAEDGMADAEITVLDPVGRVLVDYDPVAQGFANHDDYKRNLDVIGKLNLADMGVESARRAVNGEKGAMVSTHARKKIDQASGYARSVGAYTYPGLGWSTLVRIPAGEAFAV